VQHVRRLYVDCDADTLLVQVHQEGVACHTGNPTCFFQRVRPDRDRCVAAAIAVSDERAPSGMLGRLERIVNDRKTSPPPGSYVGGLLARGEAAICRKIGEEAVEVVTAALGGEGDRRVVEEVADLWFHTMVLLGHRSIPFDEILEELGRRHAERDGR
jgi:phosphoribosyl-ATP pyrophosphohydrolase/phosphoribosyl-AMP cyclohydrolase